MHPNLIKIPEGYTGTLIAWPGSRSPITITNAPANTYFGYSFDAEPSKMYGGDWTLFYIISTDADIRGHCGIPENTPRYTIPIDGEDSGWYDVSSSSNIQYGGAVRNKITENPFGALPLSDGIDLFILNRPTIWETFVELLGLTKANAVTSTQTIPVQWRGLEATFEITVTASSSGTDTDLGS